MGKPDRWGGQENEGNHQEIEGESAGTVVFDPSLDIDEMREKLQDNLELPGDFFQNTVIDGVRGDKTTEVGAMKVKDEQKEEVGVPIIFAQGKESNLILLLRPINKALGGHPTFIEKGDQREEIQLMEQLENTIVTHTLILHTDPDTPRGGFGALGAVVGSFGLFSSGKKHHHQIMMVNSHKGLEQPAEVGELNYRARRFTRGMEQYYSIVDPVESAGWYYRKLSENEFNIDELSINDEDDFEIIFDPDLLLLNLILVKLPDGRQIALPNKAYYLDQSPHTENDNEPYPTITAANLPESLASKKGIDIPFSNEVTEKLIRSGELYQLYDNDAA
jgi:hypothetical protein